jgi:hypothetical protein
MESWAREQADQLTASPRRGGAADDLDVAGGWAGADRSVSYALAAITILVALGMGGLGRRARPDDVVIGGVFTWILGLGVFFLTLYTTTRSGTGNGSASVTVLFGSIFGLSASRALLTALIAVGISAAVLAIARPLLFASLDEDVAADRILAPGPGRRAAQLGRGLVDRGSSGEQVPLQRRQPGPGDRAGVDLRPPGGGPDPRPRPGRGR